MRGCVELLGSLEAPTAECAQGPGGPCLYFEPVFGAGEVGGHLMIITSAQRSKPSTPPSEGSQRWDGCAGVPVCPRHTLYPAWRGGGVSRVAGATKN